MRSVARPDARVRTRTPDARACSHAHTRAQMSLGAEMELTLGKCQALVERRKRDTGVHTGWSLVYRLTNRLRVLLARNFGDASGRAIVEYTQAPN